MVILFWLLLLVPAVGEPASHVLAWVYTSQSQDTGFVVERCTNQAAGCSMARIATVTPTARRYTDRTAPRHRSVCYQVGARDAHQVYLWSNMVCGR